MKEVLGQPPPSRHGVQGDTYEAKPPQLAILIILTLDFLACRTVGLLFTGFYSL